MCIDAKSIYGCIVNRNTPVSVLEKRSALELLAYLQNTRNNGCETRWVQQRNEHCRLPHEARR